MATVERTIELADRNKLDLGVHIIIGIPGETISHMQETVNFITSQPAIKEVKFHNLVVYKNTRLAEMYQTGEFELLNIDQYIEILCSLLPWLRGDIVVSRLFTSNIRRTQIALGEYSGTKTEWLNKLRLSLLAKGLFQGCRTEFPYRPQLDN
jgi:radical SAM superfamily enzyme